MLQIPSITIDKADSWSILEGMLEHARQPCSIVICSFSVTDGWIRRLLKLKNEGKVTHITLVLDFAVMTRHREIILFLTNVADKVYLNNSHAKLIYVVNDTFEAVAVMSANATMNYRIETFYITNREAEIFVIKEDLKKIYDNSISITGSTGTGRIVL